MAAMQHCMWHSSALKHLQFEEGDANWNLCHGLPLLLLWHGSSHQPWLRSSRLCHYWLLNPWSSHYIWHDSMLVSSCDCDRVLSHCTTRLVQGARHAHSLSCVCSPRRRAGGWWQGTLPRTSCWPSSAWLSARPPQPGCRLRAPPLQGSPCPASWCTWSQGATWAWTNRLGWPSEAVLCCSQRPQHCRVHESIIFCSE